MMNNVKNTRKEKAHSVIKVSGLRMVLGVKGLQSFICESD